MTKVLIICSAMLTVLSASHGQEQQATAGPRIECEQPVFEFGEKENTATVEHTFTVENAGDDLLNITRVKPSCGCTVAQISRKVVPPGETADITARLNLRGRRGTQRKNITVESNDPTNPRLILRMQGQVVQDFEVRPTRLHFGQISDTESATRAVEIISRTEGDMQISGVEASKENIETTVDTIKEGSHYRIQATLNPPFKGGMFTAELIISTTHPKQPLIKLPVSAQILGDLLVAPDRLVITSRNGQPVTRYIIVRKGSVKEFSITDVELPDERMQYAVHQLGTHGYRIQISMIHPSETLEDTEVTIHTDVDTMSTISVPLAYR